MWLLGADSDGSFFRKQLWEDLNGLLLGVACTARFNLASFPEGGIVQRRPEHVRQGAGSHSNPLSYEASRLTAVAGTVRSGALGIKGNSSASHISMEEALSPLAKRP